MTGSGLARPRDRCRATGTSDSNFKQPARSQDAASRSRRAFRASFALEPSALRSEGAGNAGRPMRPQAACARIVVVSTRVSQVTPESPGIPRAMVLRLIPRSPRRPAFLPPSLADVSANLMPASGHQDHTTSPSAKPAPSSSAPLASTASRPTSVTIAKRPSRGTGRRGIKR